jgi:rhodanese-related sulfurtransferase
MNKINKMVLFAALLLSLAMAACSGAAAGDVSVDALPASVNVQTVASVMDDPGVILIDVREQWEYDEAHIPGITLIPLAELPARIHEIPTDREVIVTCRTGNRSGQAVSFLMEQGFDNVHNMEGGIVAWEAAGLPVEP